MFQKLAFQLLPRQISSPLLVRTLLLLICCGLLVLTACNSTSASLSATTDHGFYARLLQGSSSGDWPMFGYDLGHTGYVDPLVHPQSVQGKLVWAQKLGPIFSSPV